MTSEDCHGDLFRRAVDDGEDLVTYDSDSPRFLPEDACEDHNDHFLEEDGLAESYASDGFLPTDCDTTEMPIATQMNNFWSPSSDCGRWVSRWSPLGPQGQVLLANVYLNVQKICSTASNVARAALGTLSGERSTPRNLARALTSTLIGVGTRKVQEVMASMQSSWTPVAPPTLGVAANTSDDEVASSSFAERNIDITMIILREIVHCAFYGLPDITVTRALCRHRLAGAEIGKNITAASLSRWQSGSSLRACS